MMDFVRRRRWVRTYCRSGQSTTATAPTLSQIPSSETSDAAGAAEEERRVLGVVQAGATLPLPQDWHSAGQQLQVHDDVLAG